MKVPFWKSLVPAVFVLLALGLSSFFKPWRENSPAPEVITVARGTLDLRTPLAGTLVPVETVSVRSPSDGAATIVWIAADGEPVTEGEAVVRFDASHLEDTRIGLQRDLDLAHAEHRALVEARQPLELQALDVERLTMENQLLAQEQLALDTKVLVDEGLVSSRELEQQEAQLRSLAQRLAMVSNQWTLTRTRLHPLAVERSQASVRAARQALRRLEQQMSNCVVRAQSGGVVRRLQVSIGQERRPLRIGDVVYRNQAMLEVADLRALEVKSTISESDLARVQVGMRVALRFPAFPNLRLNGQVTEVGLQPEGADGRFGVRIAVEAADASLRPGLSVRCSVQTASLEGEILLPREAIRWTNGRAQVDVLVGANERVKREVTLGLSAMAQLQVLEGLEPGERVVLP